MTPADDEKWMGEALKLAQQAAQADEVPIGAVWVLDGKILGHGFNQREKLQDPTSHAELEAIRTGAKAINNWRMGGSLYVTLEPCPMCFGAILQARIERLIFGCRDPKAGAVGSMLNLSQGYAWNHQVKVTEGVLADECQKILQIFFKKLRT